MSNPPKLQNPLHYASGYSLDLYCDTDADGCFEMGMFYGQSFADCARAAKAKGWAIHRKTRTATCPNCRKRKP